MLTEKELKEKYPNCCVTIGEVNGILIIFVVEPYTGRIVYHHEQKI